MRKISKSQKLRKRNKNRTRRNNQRKQKGGWEIIKYDNIDDNLVKSINETLGNDSELTTIGELKKKISDDLQVDYNNIFIKTLPGDYKVDDYEINPNDKLKIDIQYDKIAEAIKEKNLHIETGRNIREPEIVHIMNQYGDIYYGYFFNNLPNGEGTMNYKNGDIYEGEWTNGKRNGYGVMNYKLPGNDVYDIYEGNWVNDKKEGKGFMTDSLGNTYEGEWKNNMKHGKGIEQTVFPIYGEIHIHLQSFSLLPSPIPANTV
jgi:hypothetical protein